MSTENGDRGGLRIGLVGHCSPDSAMLTNFAERAVPGAKLKRVNDDAALERELASFDLLLVNRALDGDFPSVGDAGTGIDLIRNLAKRGDGPAMVLVSNFADAQQAAVEAGAMPGFGKSELGLPHAGENLRAAAAKAATLRA